MNRKFLCVAAGGLTIAVLLTIGIPTCVAPREGATYENYGRIENGMTHEQVKAILGKPDPGFHEGFCQWKSAHGQDIFFVRFDENGRVEGSAWNGWSSKRTAWQKLSDRMPWLTALLKR